MGGLNFGDVICARRYSPIGFVRLDSEHAQSDWKSVCWTFPEFAQRSTFFGELFVFSAISIFLSILTNPAFIFLK